MVIMTSVMNSSSCLPCLVGNLVFSSDHAFIHAGERAGKTEKSAPQDDKSHLAELYLGFVEDNLIAKRAEKYIDEFLGC